MNMNTFGIKISGLGRLIRKGKKMDNENGSVEYGLPENENKSMMDDLVVKPSDADDETVQAVREHIDEEIEKGAESVMLNEDNIAVPSEEKLPVEESKSEFDPNALQDALKDSELEGGVFKMRTTGSSALDNEQPKGAEYYKPSRELNSSQAEGKYEVSGFTVQYEPKSGGGLSSVQVRDYFDDIETAKASVSKAGYLIPLKNGYKIGKITLGCPIICLNERQLFEYVNGQWRRA